MINAVNGMRDKKPELAGAKQWSRLARTKDNLLELVLETYLIIEPEKTFFEGEAKV